MQSSLQLQCIFLFCIQIIVKAHKDGELVLTEKREKVIMELEKLKKYRNYLIVNFSKYFTQNYHFLRSEWLEVFLILCLERLQEMQKPLEVFCKKPVNGQLIFYAVQAFVLTFFSETIFSHRRHEIVKVFLIIERVKLWKKKLVSYWEVFLPDQCVKNIFFEENNKRIVQTPKKFIFLV